MENNKENIRNSEKLIAKGIWNSYRALVNRKNRKGYLPFVERVLLEQQQRFLDQFFNSKGA